MEIKLVKKKIVDNGVIYEMQNIAFLKITCMVGWKLLFAHVVKTERVS